MSAATRQPFVPEGPFGLQIGGEEPVPNGRFEAIDPSTGQPWAEVAQASAADVERAVATAAKAFKSWRRSSPAQRQEVLWRLADAVEADPERWARLLATENGRPIREATIADVPTCAGILRFFSGLARDLRGDQVPVERAETLIYSLREPLGVIGALIPWNSPIITTANKVGPALAAGNTVVLKPSEFASPSVVEFARLANEILPEGVLNVVTGFGPEVGAALVSHPDVAKITFTGGTATARKIMAAAGEALTPTIMELGGKGAMVVFDDADVEAAVQDALLGIFMANGEVCVAASRLLVQSGIHDAFRERFAEVTERIVVGDALDPATQFGPMVTREHRERVTAALGRRSRRARWHGSAAVSPSCRRRSTAASSSPRPCWSTSAARPARRARSSSARSPCSSASRTRPRRSPAPTPPVTASRPASGRRTSAARIGSPTSSRAELSGSTSGSTCRSGCRWAGSRTAASAAS